MRATAKTAKKTAPKAKRAKSINLKSNPFPTIRFNKLPERLGRESTNYGWEDLIRPKLGKRIPWQKIVAARASLQHFLASHKEDTEGHFVGVGGPLKIATQKAVDDDGNVIPRMDGDKVVTDKRGNPEPMFYDFIRVR